MNRHDEIFCKARDIASHVHVDPEARDAMATQLIELIGLMFGAVGKYVAIKGESASNDVCDNAPACGHAECDVQQHHTIYIAGERMQDAARELVPEVVDADIERYSRPTGTEWCVCGHHPDSHKPGGCIGVTHNKHECTDGPCTEFRVKLPEPVWTHVDRRPWMMRHMDERGALYLPPTLADAQREFDERMAAEAATVAGQAQAQAVAEMRRQIDAALLPPVEMLPKGRWVTAAGKPCVCVPVPITDGAGRVMGFDPHPGRCTWQQDEQRPSLAAERCCYPDPDEAPGHPCRIGRGWCCYPLGGVCPVHL